ncbi:hypothetical protein BC833DRAFT_622008 [Globomyces pollinis-pini]|nr:hypothetical protein BC833DRAFT_622008 [Globomyces pollinis-pini]
MTDSKLPKVDGTIQIVPLSQLDKAITIQSLYEMGPCLFYILRNPFCYLCEQMLLEIKNTVAKFEEYNVTVHIIVKKPLSDEQLEQLGFQKDMVYIDFNYDLCRVIGNDDGEFRSYAPYSLLPRVWCNAYFTSGKEEIVQYLPGDDDKILGGTLLVSRYGEILFKSLESTAGQLPDFGGLLQAAVALFYQKEAASEYEKAFSEANLLALGMDFSKLV